MNPLLTACESKTATSQLVIKCLKWLANLTLHSLQLFVTFLKFPDFLTNYLYTLYRLVKRTCICNYLIFPGFTLSEYENTWRPLFLSLSFPCICSSSCNYVNSDFYFLLHDISVQFPNLNCLHTLFTVFITLDIVPHFQHCMTRTDVVNAEKKVFKKCCKICKNIFF